ncbi:MAG TPA: type II secretion system protein N [Pseudomonadales bacterium]|nr:type II secretion system protein N [Pseudomonadales bacterium]
MEAIADRLETPLALLLALGLAVSIASGVWFFVGGAETDVPLAPVVGPAADPAARGRAPLGAAEIAALNLFGAPLAAEALRTQGENAPETRLQLELHGVFLAQPTVDSSAIVAERNRDGTLYRVGDRLPGNAELVEVLADRIVLRRAGRLETLRFPDATDGRGFVVDDGSDDLAVSAAARVGTPALYQPGQLPEDASFDADGNTDLGAEDRDEDRDEDSLRATIGRIQEQLDVDPQGTLAQLGVEPVSSDGTGGYRIGSEIPAERLSSVGLREGDVVLSVNGRAVGDIEQDRAELQGLVDAGSARLEIQRGERRFFVTTRIQ